MDPKPNFKTVVISDIHIGSKHSKVREVTKFLSSLECDRLILNGDIIDGWQLKNSENRWTVTHSAFFHTIMTMMERHGTDVIYVSGNHDDFLDPLVPSQLFNVSIVSEITIESGQKKYVVLHGHAFDGITAHMRWLAKLGDLAYNILLKFNKAWNNYRIRRGKEYYSLSQVIKQKVKQAVSAISGFESDLTNFAIAKGCDGVICGHIHHPDDKIIGGSIHYLNSGDWVESLTGLVEDENHQWRVVSYKDFVPTDDPSLS